MQAVLRLTAQAALAARRPSGHAASNSKPRGLWKSVVLHRRPAQKAHENTGKNPLGPRLGGRRAASALQAGRWTQTPPPPAQSQGPAPLMQPAPISVPRPPTN
ncbi:unnamed protein product [Prorocentrum cordatum]|uniref:Uncharacterized protein n=1 Tax=Prorocentrum cordatum TaxID=2364126 RepID=A0ABN9RI37_9DINO|nr:unnamed protein product [Polarella glacialis]